MLAAAVRRRTQLAVALPNALPFGLLFLAGTIGPLRQVLPGEVTNAVLIAAAGLFVIQIRGNPVKVLLGSSVQIILAALLGFWTLIGSPFFVQDLAYAVLTVVYMGAFITAFRISERTAVMVALAPIIATIAASVIAYVASDASGRMFGIGGSWSVLQTGMYGTLGVCLLFALRLPFALAGPGFAILLTGVVMTASRSAVFATGFATVIVLAVTRYGMRIVFIGGISAGVVAFLLAESLGISRLGSVALDPVRQGAINSIVSTATLVGAGIRHSFVPGSSDSVVFLLAETGYLGTAMVVTIFLLSGRAYLRGFRSAATVTPVFVAMAAAFVGMIAIELFHDYVLDQHFYFWLPVAYIIARGRTCHASK